MPKGMNSENGVLKIIKAVYGFKQSPRNWNQELRRLLSSLKFVQSQVDHCLYSLRVPKIQNGKRIKDSILHLTVYVDDVAMFGDKELIDWCIKKVSQTYTITTWSTNTQERLSHTNQSRKIHKQDSFNLCNVTDRLQS